MGEDSFSDDIYETTDPWDEVPDFSSDEGLYKMAKAKSEASGIKDIGRPEKEGLEYEPYMTKDYYLPGYREEKNYFDVPPVVGQLLFYMDNIREMEGLDVNRDEVVGGDLAPATPDMSYRPNAKKLRPTMNDFGNSFKVDTSSYRVPGASSAWF